MRQTFRRLCQEYGADSIPANAGREVVFKQISLYTPRSAVDSADATRQQMFPGVLESLDLDLESAGSVVLAMPLRRSGGCLGMLCGLQFCTTAQTA
ncbi:hypothetical protein TARUN_4063 [Trichoderma arundinaceum]|uniref:Uncharacterized protein n=1 Tax=Trichoderma arundinaceum TaxID=490622 RepID=A0A395NQ14_TRIAR|nr:hypothetical protein TARUN_4063 [Trichoderma arundinaceum]